jgi:serine/threonine protein kinase
MEYLGGGELEWRTTTRRPAQTVLQSTRIIRDVMLGLRYCTPPSFHVIFTVYLLSITVHLQGIVHRDIKPANLLWSKDHVTVKISDFGVSVYEIPINRKEDEVSANEAEFLELMGDKFLNRVAGTPAFLAPEVCPNHDDQLPDQYSKFAVDTWALGVTYYCLLFGRPPWEGNDYWMLLNSIATEDFEIPPTMGSDQLQTGGRHPSKEDTDGVGVLSILDGLLTKDPSTRLTLVGLKVTFDSRFRAI